MREWPNPSNDGEVTKSLVRTSKTKLLVPVDYFPDAVGTGEYFKDGSYPIDGMNGFYVPETDRIAIFHNASWRGCLSAVAICLAHEMGHAQDFAEMPLWQMEETGKAYRWREAFKCSSRKAFGRLKSRLYRTEEKAWDRAIPFLREAGFKDWAMYEFDRETCLAGYLDIHNIG